MAISNCQIFWPNSPMDGSRMTEKNGKRKPSTRRILGTPKILLKEVGNQVRVGSKVLIYNGQMDVIIWHAIGTKQMVWELPWKDKDEFAASKRHIWYVDDEVAGYEGHAAPVF